MKPRITRFILKGLRGFGDFDFTIQDNRLVLIGENGSGKSTLVSILYATLTGQIPRIQQFGLKYIGVEINGVLLELGADQLSLENQIDAEKLERLPSVLRRLMVNEPGAIESILSNRRQLGDIAESAGVSSFILERELVRILDRYPILEAPIRDFRKRIKELVGGTVLYLPTYRRIERDLRNVFTHLDDDLERFAKRQREVSADMTRYIELVEFGMKDVESAISVALLSLNKGLTTRLQTLTGSHLKDVVRASYENEDFARLANLKEHTLEAILSRIDDQTLPQADKQTLRKMLPDLQSKAPGDTRGKIMAQFITKLLDLHTEQKRDEEPIRKFSEMCNKYVAGKRLVFDDATYRFKIIADVDPNTPLALNMLSSGEKQIISLFSHLYLSGNTGYVVLIDEPELSLSVPWQRTFLPDVADTGLCNALVAVTHSPFIYDNKLQSYVRHISELRAK